MGASAQSDELHPVVEPSCTVCGGDAFALLCDAQELDAQATLARRFHVARLARARGGELEERAAFTQDYATHLVACTSCGCLLRSPRPTRHAIERAYAEDEYPDDRLEEMLASQVALFRRKVAPLRRLLGAPRRILEVGSFVGGFLEVARTAGWSAVGLDPGIQVAELCRSRGLDVRACTLEEHVASGSAEAVDCLAVWNTFDQLPDPAPLLEAARRCVRRDGILALRVPHGAGFERLRSKLRGSHRATRRFYEACLAWNNLLGFPYLHGYSIPCLDLLLGRFGFERVRAEGDVLGILAGRSSADWARREEIAVKRLQRAWIRTTSRRRGAALAAAPWIDVYYARR